MNFTINNDIKAGKEQLQGFDIHEVTFRGVEKEDIKSEKTGQTYKVIKIKFDNKNGYFTHTIFEPDPSKGHDKRQKSQYGENPAVVELVQETFKMLIQAVNPELYQEISDGNKTFSIKTWDDMRNLFISATKDGIGVETKIKLYKDNKGKPTFPAFFLSINKEGEVYRNTTFIGRNLAWSDKELKKIQNFKTATPTNMSTAGKASVLNDLDVDDVDQSGVNIKSDSLDDLDL